MTHKTQVSIKIPNIESLYCINCKVNPVDAQDPLAKSLFHSQILTCRLIIYTMRCCIASPSIQNADDLIHVVVNKSFYDLGKFQEHLSKLKVCYTDPEPVHPQIYEACLKYTFTFRLAPHWNLIGKSFYLQSFNFLSFTSNINAIEWNILFKNSNDIKLELVPIKMNLFPLTIDSLSLPPKTVDGFTLNPNINSIDLTSFESPWVYVLPKLTKARIVSVSKILPESCPFQNYNDFRRHWKNMYSYRLLKNEQGLLFYEVVFPSQPNQSFTYPETCILSKMPQILMCNNKNEVASQFLKDFSNNVHSVCGEVIQVCQLYPELNIEYSCILKKKSTISENQSSQLQQSAFFKTPAELIMQPLNKKLNLSSLFTYKGMDKMKPNMRNHSQKVLSIMQNKKRKNKSMKEDENEYLTQSIFNCKKRKFGVSQNCFPSIPNIKQKKTVVTNLDDVISFYDLPSTCSKNDELEKSNQDTHFQQNENSTSANPLYQSYKPQPVIKNVENVCFDLTDAHLPTNFNELKINKNETNEEDDKNFVGENSCNTRNYSVPKSLDSMEKRDIPQHSVSSQFRKELYNSATINNDNVYRKLQSSIHSVDLNNRVLSELLPKETNNKTFDSVETQQSYDQKIRSFLSSFDLYNRDDEDDDEIGIKKQLYEQYKKLPAKLDLNNKISNENEIQKTFEKSELMVNCQNNSKYNVSQDKWADKSSENSPSLLNSKKGNSIDIFRTYSKEMLKKNNKEYIQPEGEYLLKNGCIVKKGYDFCQQSVSETKSTDSKKIFQSKNHEEKFFETPLTSTLTNDIFEESPNRKILQKFESPINKKNLENMQNSDFAENSKIKSNKKSYRESNNSSFTFDNLQNSQYSTDKLQSCNEVQAENTLQHKKDVNEYVEQSDFLSILSESSNGSETGDYESCKLVFTEALTLKK